MHPRFMPRVEGEQVFYDPRARRPTASERPRGKRSLLVSLLAAVAAAAEFGGAGPRESEPSQPSSRGQHEL